MSKPLLASLMLAALVLYAAAVQEPKQEPQEQQPPPEPPFVIPPEEASRKNPVKPDQLSISQGKRLYDTQCVFCHGTDGSGKTDLAATMQLNLRDYSNPEALKEFTDGELFYILKKGKGKMPGQEGRMRDRQMWHLVNYIRSLAKKEGG